MTEQWTSDPGTFPPTSTAVPTGWRTQVGQLAPGGPPTFGSGPAMEPSSPPPPPPPGRTTRRLLVAIGVLAVLLLVMSAAFVVAVRQDDPEVASGPTSTTAAPSTTRPSGPGGSTPNQTPGPSTPGQSTPPSTIDPTPQGPAPTQAELDAEIAEMSNFVEIERGLTFTTPVQVTMADEATFDQLLFQDFDEDKDTRAESERVLKALGLVPGDLDLEQAMRQLLSGGVLGFYDPETAKLVVRGQAITPYTRETLVHELTHAIDDQNFHIDRPEYDTSDDEISFGFSSVLEGNARRIEDAYVKAMSPADQARRDLEEQQFAMATQPTIAGLPPVLIELLQAPYEEGQPFVEQLLDAGGQPQLDAAIDDPPTTSTQVLHIDSYLDGVGAVPVDPPKAEGDVVDQGVFGELMTRFTLEDGGDPNTATTAATGWAGDWYVTWQDGPDNTCIRIAYAMQTPTDLDQLEDAYEDWAAPKGATVERAGDRLEVTSCSAAAGGTSPL